MKSLIKRLACKYTPESLKFLYVEEFRRKTHYKFLNQSFSQEGEDMILRKIFSGKEKGFFVDVGAHHPFRFSNTYFFYKKGWRGINIDPLPESMKLFNKCRPEDINLELGVSNEPGELDYYMYKKPEFNTFSQVGVAYAKAKWNETEIATKKIKTDRLANILNKYNENSRQIDFLTIDVEGLDFEVLISNDWKKFKPRYILVEDRNLSLIDPLKNETSSFLHHQGYSLFAKTVNTCFFKLEI